MLGLGWRWHPHAIPGRMHVALPSSAQRSSITSAGAQCHPRLGEERDLSRLSRHMPPLGPSTRPHPHPSSCHKGSAPSHVAMCAPCSAEESSRLQQVLQHPAYVADPIAAITNHLRHTLPPPPVAGAGKGAARGAAAGKGGAGGKAGKKRGAKGSGSAMEE